MRIKEILEVMQGELLSGNPETDIDPSKISTDSRTIKKGELFIALKGPNFDGDDFIEDAFKAGAIGAIATNWKSKLGPLSEVESFGFAQDSSLSFYRRVEWVKDCRRIIIHTKDATKALQDIANHHRMGFKLPVIGVTGSNGKTTVKDMIYSVLSRRYDVLKNEGTKNNQIGVPQTLLKLKNHHDMCVLEMGTNHRGEMRLLGKIAKPTIAVIMNVGPAHLEFLGDLKGVFEAKKELLESLDEKGLAILNGDDQFLSGIKNGRFDILKFGFNESNDFRATDFTIKKNRIEFLLNDKVKFQLNLLGAHNIYNALAAIATGSQFDISYESMRKALFDYKPSHMRLNLKEMDGIEIIDDSYNSNPLSMECALEVLKSYPARTRWVVSGDMLELGRCGRHFHKLLGQMIANSGVEGLLTIGKFSKATLSQAKVCGVDRDNLWHCATHNEAAKILKRVLKKGDVVLIKGSRAMRMDKVIEKLKG